MNDATSNNITDRLRNQTGMPKDDDEAFRWYMDIADEAANRIEQLEADNLALRHRLAEADKVLSDVLDAWA